MTERPGPELCGEPQLYAVGKCYWPDCGCALAPAIRAGIGSQPAPDWTVGEPASSAPQTSSGPPEGLWRMYAPQDALASPAPAAKPVAWRWRAKGDDVWKYRSTKQTTPWFGFEYEPLYSAAALPKADKESER